MHRINVYHRNVSPRQVFTDNPYARLTTIALQQKRLLLQAGNSEHKPHKAFKRDLTIFLKERRSRGDKLLLHQNVVGNFNEVLGSELKGMCQVAADMQLINLMLICHHQSPPVTYSRGKGVR